jgi:photoactive yellow protein
MAAPSVDFDATDLAATLDEFDRKQIDALPFGAIELDAEGRVVFYSATESRLSGCPSIPPGRDFFTVARCMSGDDFRGRIMRAREEGAVDLEFGWVGDYNDPKRDMRIRVQSSRRGGVWIFIERDRAG